MDLIELGYGSKQLDSQHELQQALDVVEQQVATGSNIAGVVSSVGEQRIHPQNIPAANFLNKLRQLQFQVHATRMVPPQAHRSLGFSVDKHSGKVGILILL